MIELPLVFLGGLLGSSHCIGMCGPLAVALGSNHAKLKSNLVRQLSFSAGRIFTYGFGGAAAAFTGWWLAQRPLAVINIQAVISMVAGVALIVIGLPSTGSIPPLVGRWFAVQPCNSAQFLKGLLTGPGILSPALAGVFTGFIPCGLVYAFLAYAATTGNVLYGWLTMSVFGLGTMPLMVLVGCGSTLLSLTGRTRAMKIAAWSVVATGFISVLRGAGFLGLAADDCPFCH